MKPKWIDKLKRGDEIRHLSTNRIGMFLEEKEGVLYFKDDDGYTFWLTREQALSSIVRL